MNDHPFRYRPAFLLSATLLLLAGQTALARDVGPIGPGTPGKADQVIAKSLGLKLGEAYGRNREILIRAAWKPELPPAGEPVTYKEFPEISCGSGMDAVCQGAFSQGKRSLLLTVDQNKKGLPVVHVEE